MLRKVHASYFVAPNLCQVLRRYGHSTGSGSPCCDPEKDLLALHPPCQPLTGVCLVRFEKSGKGRRLWHQESGQLNHLAGWFLLARERVAGGMIPYYSMHRTKEVLRGHAAPGPLDHAISTRWAVSTQASPWCRAASRIRPRPAARVLRSVRHSHDSCSGSCLRSPSSRKGAPLLCQHQRPAALTECARWVAGRSADRATGRICEPVLDPEPRALLL